MHPLAIGKGQHEKLCRNIMAKRQKENKPKHKQMKPSLHEKNSDKLPDQRI